MNNCINNYNIYNSAAYGRKEKKASRLTLAVEFLIALCELVVEVLESPMVRRITRIVIGVGLVLACYFFVGAVIGGTIGAFRAVCTAVGIVSVGIRVFGVRASD
ncbi:MAG: hypothetical protein IKJ80_04270 [Clostridia bacterium]|nr:hypothetical protein [Clostridia bacterium]